jgi:AcrR family transcriptional regulator
VHQATPAVRKAILAAAGRIIAREGSERLTIASVAAEAGLSVGGLRYHFASKRDLLSGLVDASVEGFDRMLASAGSEPGDRTRAYIAATLSDCDGSFDLASGLLAAVAIDSTLLQPLQHHFHRWQDLLAHDGIDPSVATAVRLAMDGWWLSAFLGLSAPQGEAAQRTSAFLDTLVSRAIRDV